MPKVFCKFQTLLPPLLNLTACCSHFCLPSWWARTRTWEQAALCWSWMTPFQRWLRRASSLTDGKCIYTHTCPAWGNVCMSVFTHDCPSSGWVSDVYWSWIAWFWDMCKAPHKDACMQIATCWLACVRATGLGCHRRSEQAPAAARTERINDHESSERRMLCVAWCLYVKAVPNSYE